MKKNKHISSKKTYITKVDIAILVAVFVMLVVLIMENAKLAPSILNTGIMVISGVLVYFAVLLILRDDFFMGYIKKMLRK